MSKGKECKKYELGFSGVELMMEGLVLPLGFSFRRMGADDGAFSFSLFCSAHPELASLPLPPQQLELLLRQQYRSQQMGYAELYPLAHSLVVEYHSVSVGEIVLDQSSTSLHIANFIMAPQWRGCGYGSMILESFQVYAVARNINVSLSVDAQNLLAKKFYSRLNFKISRSTETHDFMLWEK